MSHFEDIMQTYDTIHRAPLNRLSHAIGIPLIMLSMAGFASYVRVPGSGFTHVANLATLLVVLTTSIVMSWSRAAGVAYFLLSVTTCLAAYAITGTLGVPAAQISLGAAFILGWIFQFIGHRFEGKSPEFVKRPENLLLGPVMIMAEIYPALRTAARDRPASAP